MLSISVIILTYNEEIHIARAIENVLTFTDRIFIVDSFSTDKTVEIAENLGAEIFQNKWENNYAKQFNWALDNLPITTEWILRLDADEYLTDELINEMNERLILLPTEVSGVAFKLGRVFMNREVCKRLNIRLLRLFRNGRARCEQRLMDEHMEIQEGITIDFGNVFFDHNLNDISWWSTKHIGYAIREAVDLLNVEYRFSEENDNNGELSDQAKAKRAKKIKYALSPLFLRSFLYFIYRYFYKLGILEGKEGFIWHFMQGWWYRTLVDVKVLEIKKACGEDKSKMIEYIEKKYSIRL